MSTISDEIYSIQSELNQIINELNSISADLNGNKFYGIGTEKCASKIKEQSNKYKKTINALRQVNVNNYREGFGPNAKNTS